MRNVGNMLTLSIKCVRKCKVDLDLWAKVETLWSWNNTGKKHKLELTVWHTIGYIACNRPCTDLKQGH